MEATWAATQTVVRELVIRQITEADFSDEVDFSTTSTRATGKKADGKTGATSTTSKGVKSTSILKKADKLVMT